MTYNLDKNAVVQTLKKVIAEVGPEHVAEDCVIFVVARDEDDNVVDGTKVPSCVVGQFIYEVVGEEEFQNVVGGFVDDPLASVGIKVDREGYQILREAQLFQDGASTDVHDERFPEDSDTETLSRAWGGIPADLERAGLV